MYTNKYDILWEMIKRAYAGYQNGAASYYYPLLLISDIS